MQHKTMVLLSCLILSSCTHKNLSIVKESNSSASMEDHYEYAVRNASVVDSSDLCDTLIAITKENPRLVWNSDSSKILMTMWKSQESYEKFYKSDSLTSPSEEYVTWVTTVPQVQDFGKAYIAAVPSADSMQVTKRIKQYLGLMPEWNYDVFIEVWVDPADLFRPCVDPEIDDEGCNISFSKELPRVKNIKDYKAFYQNLYFNDFRTRPGIPWTGLGYTYDWGTQNLPVGASEFILVPGAKFEIKEVIQTMDYFRQ